MAVSSVVSLSEGMWLCRSAQGEVLGPFTEQDILKQMQQGLLTEQTPLAAEGGDFVLMKHIPLFHQAWLQCLESKRCQKVLRLTRCVWVCFVLSLCLLLGYGLFLVRSYHAQLHTQKRLHKQREIQQHMFMQAALDAGHGLDLVGLRAVPAASEGHVVLSAQPKKVDKEQPKMQGTTPFLEKPLDNNEGLAVSGCGLEQEHIFSVLRRHVSALNTCVLEEKKRHPEGGLPAVVEVSFVVRPSGRVVEFDVDDPSMQEGGLRNCFMRVVNSMVFPEHGGTSCPVSVPVRISQT
jgi:hypothetical protein